METEKKKYNVSKTLLQQLTEVTTLAVARFIIYYYTPEDRRKKWDDFKGCDSLIKTHTYEDCLEWLQRGCRKHYRCTIRLIGHTK